MARAVHKLSDVFVARLPAPDPEGKQRIYWDRALPGFGCMVSGATTVKSWVVQRGSEIPRLSIERCDLMPYAEAYETALGWMREIARGENPKTKLKDEIKARKEAAKVTALTLETALGNYLDARPLRPETAATYKNILKANCADWLGQPVATLTPAMLAKRHREIRERIKKKGSGTGGASSANLALRVVRVILDHVKGEHPELVKGDFKAAMRGIWAKEPRRERSVRFDKLPAYWEAVCGLENILHRTAIQLLTLTGCRFKEIVHLRWDEVDLTEATITLSAERNKAGRIFLCPLSDLAVETLRELRALGVDKSGYCFPSYTGRPITGLEAAFRVIGKALEQRLSAHDLRRLYCTTALDEDAAGLSLATVKRLLNHAPENDVTLGYHVRASNDLRKAQQRVTDALRRLCGMPGDNVVKLRPEAAA